HADAAAQRGAAAGAVPGAPGVHAQGRPPRVPRHAPAGRRTGRALSTPGPGNGAPPPPAVREFLPAAPPSSPRPRSRFDVERGLRSGTSKTFPLPGETLMNVIGSKARNALAGACAMVLAAGCARVKPEELSAELTRLREEMRNEYQQGDERVVTDLGGRLAGLDARLDAVANELDRLSETFDVTVQRLEGAIRFNAPVYFAFDDATIREEDRPVLDQFASVIKS